MRYAPFEVVDNQLVGFFGFAGRRGRRSYLGGKSGWGRCGLGRGAGAVLDEEGVDAALLAVLLVRLLGLRDRQFYAWGDTGVQYRLVAFEVGKQGMPHSGDLSGVDPRRAVVALMLLIIAKGQHKGDRCIDLEYELGGVIALGHRSTSAINWGAIKTTRTAVSAARR